MGHNQLTLKPNNVPNQPTNFQFGSKNHPKGQKNPANSNFETFRSGKNNSNFGMNSLIFKKNSEGLKNSQSQAGQRPQLQLAQNPQVDQKNKVGFGSAFSQQQNIQPQNRHRQNMFKKGVFSKKNSQNMMNAPRNKKGQFTGQNPLSVDVSSNQNMDKHKRIQHNINLRKNIQNSGGVYSENPLKVQPTFTRKNVQRKNKLPQYQNFGNSGQNQIFRK